MAAELGGLGPPAEDINKGESEADKGLITFLTLLIAMFLMLFLPMAVGGILCLAASMAIRKAGETEPDATEVAAVVTVVLMGTSAICGGVGFLLETAVGELTDVLTVYRYTVEMAVKVIFIVVSPFMAALAAGVSVQFGKGAVKLRAAAGIGTGILAALRSQSILGHWGTMGALFGPAAAAGVALSAALRRSSSSYGKAGRLGATLGAMCATCAGVGRTGCFIVIDAMVERIKHEKTVDIYGHVTLMRSQRNYMVQTEDQYAFIHDALLEAVACGNTEVPARNLHAYIQRLTQIEPAENVTGTELEFKRLASAKAHTSRFVSANLPCNKFKNRLVNIMPYESTRVCLQPIRGVEGSDYINASFIDGYRQQRAYIATQGPLAETTEDYWRMLWEHNSTIVVMLTKLREMGREKCHQYWPAERSARYQYFVVDPMAEYNMPQYILREFKVTDARDGQSRTVRQFQFTDWPEQGVPKSGEGFIDFIGQVHKTKEQFGQDGPITVHCSAGVGRTGVFITLSIVLERMRYEGVVDIFQTVKMLRTQRPATVQTEDQYQFCYRAGLEYLGSFDHYAT
ncbi:receptor-type tyrosine-protein phosphatase S [Oncorhynchus nerka]|uniref:receptor-type tyrosine-protein phosphatase S n=1 Tax=Oncorhynchus nerka TaxID=8023 RepID=UPI0031B8707B